MRQISVDPKWLRRWLQADTIVHGWRHQGWWLLVHRQHGVVSMAPSLVDIMGNSHHVKRSVAKGCLVIDLDEKLNAVLGYEPMPTYEDGLGDEASDVEGVVWKWDTVAEYAEKLGLKPVDVLLKCFDFGFAGGINLHTTLSNAEVQQLDDHFRPAGMTDFCPIPPGPLKRFTPQTYAVTPTPEANCVPGEVDCVDYAERNGLTTREVIDYLHELAPPIKSWSAGSRLFEAELRALDEHFNKASTAPCAESDRVKAQDIRETVETYARRNWMPPAQVATWLLGQWPHVSWFVDSLLDDAEVKALDDHFGITRAEVTATDDPNHGVIVSRIPFDKIDEPF
jgi:hypothetical protein